MPPLRVLFLIHRQGPYYNPHHHPHGWNDMMSSGIRFSVSFIVDLLTELGIESKLEVVVDGNDIDREVHQYRPSHVILEALWVTPTKLQEVAQLHPSVHWNVRLHSELPFLALEGIAMEWLFAYVAIPQVSISTNSLRGQRDYQKIFWRPVMYTPNYYPIYPLKQRGIPQDSIIDIGCFGAIRPLKNQFTQAVAAIDWANNAQKAIRFHINSDRLEMADAGFNVLRNLRSLFANSTPHALVEHPWLPRADFMELVATMDLGMQVSFSETFNIVSADFAILNIPLVASPEVGWVDRLFQASPTSTNDIMAKLALAFAGQAVGLQKLNYQGLMRFDADAVSAWPTALEEMR